MKAIQITMDETLLAHLDADEEVRQKGRSAVLRRLVGEFLESRREAAIDAKYRRSYADFGLDPEFQGWGEMGQWPEK